MKIYLVTQKYQGYDTYDAVVVVAENELEAVKATKGKIFHSSMSVEEIDVSDYNESAEILASFNAG